jgi:sulfite exporter TauE/SafE
MSFDPNFVSAWLAMAAFGLTGSLHCAGICGPLAAVACDSGKNGSQSPLYYVSRVATYMLLGGLAGGLGSLILRDVISWSSRSLSVGLGTIMMMYALVEVYRASKSLWRREAFRSGAVLLKESGRKFPIFHELSKRTFDRLERSGVSRSVSLGVMTALLPCCFLYAAFAQALLISNPLASAAAMLVFAVVTTPALFVGSVGLKFVYRLPRKYVGLVLSLILLVASGSIFLRGFLEPHDHSHHREASEDSIDSHDHHKNHHQNHIQ